MKTASHGITDRGRKRERNEDSILLNDAFGLYIVADGMGGHEHGDVASRTAVEEIETFLKGNLTRVPKIMLKQSGYLTGLLKEALSRANSKIHTASKKLPLGGMMGTTVSLVLVSNDKLHIAHVGDSRIYRLRNGALEQLTKDHSKVQELVDRGLLPEDEAENHHLSNVITRALGSNKDVEVDTYVFDIQNGDTLLLTTDGLIRVLDNETIAGALKRDLPVDRKCGILIGKSLEGGAPDNVSVIILEFEVKSVIKRIISGGWLSTGG